MSTSTTEPAWLNRRLYPFANRYLELDRNRIHCVDEGAGPTLLLVHGNPVWLFVYREVIEGLKDSFRCVAVDLAGFGLSLAAPGFSYLPAAQSALLGQLIERLDLRDYSVVVHDWGGPIGLSAALVAPERLAGVVLSNTWAWPVNGNPGFEKFSGLMGGPLGRLGATYLNSFVNVLVPLSHKRRRLTHAEMTQYRKPLPFGHRTPTWVLPKQIIDAREFLAALESRLPELSTRQALILWGDKDDAFETPELARWQQLLPGASTVMLEGVGHFAASEAPAQFAAAIREWRPV
ncbi:MAG: alpha/beta fold hydrolase [Solirubrobacteraceae bacterium]